jgi:hypothetical protein
MKKDTTYSLSLFRASEGNSSTYLVRTLWLLFVCHLYGQNVSEGVLSATPSGFVYGGISTGGLHPRL